MGSESSMCESLEEAGSMRKGKEGPWSRSRLIEGVWASRDLGRREVGPIHPCWPNQAWGSPSGTSGMWGSSTAIWTNVGHLDLV